MNSRKCHIYKNDVHRASFAKLFGSKKEFRD